MTFHKKFEHQIIYIIKTMVLQFFRKVRPSDGIGKHSLDLAYLRGGSSVQKRITRNVACKRYPAA
jgi:hypothetical protein